MLPIGQVLVHDRPQVRIVKPVPIQPAEQCGEPAYRHGQQAAAGGQHPASLGQSLLAVRRPRQVIQRAEQQHRVVRRIGLGELSRIAQVPGPPPTSSTRAGDPGSSRSSNSMDLTNSSEGVPPGKRRSRS
jgi:hypothetical protein